MKSRYNTTQSALNRSFASGRRLARRRFEPALVGVLPATAFADSGWSPPDSLFIYLVIGVVIVGAIASMLMVRAALERSTWSLSDALSEGTQVTSFVDAQPLLNPKTGEPVLVTMMMASTSRLIALMGMIILILMFVGFGTFALYGFAVTGKLPESIDQVGKFLLAGMTLFAPYAINKFAGIFEALGGKNG